MSLLVWRRSIRFPDDMIQQMIWLYSQVYTWHITSTYYKSHFIKVHFWTLTNPNLIIFMVCLVHCTLKEHGLLLNSSNYKLNILNQRVKLLYIIAYKYIAYSIRILPQIYSLNIYITILNTFLVCKFILVKYMQDFERTLASLAQKRYHFMYTYLRREYA